MTMMCNPGESLEVVLFAQKGSYTLGRRRRAVRAEGGLRSHLFRLNSAPALTVSNSRCDLHRTIEYQLLSVAHSRRSVRLPCSTETPVAHFRRPAPIQR